LPLKDSTGADLQHVESTEDVFDARVDVLPTAQAMSDVGKRVKSAVVQGVLLGEGEAAEGRDAIVTGCFVGLVSVRIVLKRT
jgi:hypothetical protein